MKSWSIKLINENFVLIIIIGNVFEYNIFEGKYDHMVLIQTKWKIIKI